MNTVGTKVEFLRKMHLKFLTRWIKHLTSQEVGGGEGALVKVVSVKRYHSCRKYYFL